MKKSPHHFFTFFYVFFLFPFTAQKANAHEEKMQSYLLKLKDHNHKSLNTFWIHQFAAKKGLHHYKNLPQLQHLVLGHQNLQDIWKEHSEDIEYIEPDYQLWADSDIPSSVSSKQWGLDNSANDVDIDVLSAWQTTMGDPEIVVAVVDSGIDFNHSALKKNIWLNSKELGDNKLDDDKNGKVDDLYGWNFREQNNNPVDENSHGTHVSGLIAGNSKSFKGVAPKVKIMPLKFLGSNGSGSTSQAIEAIDYAIENGAKIINCSWGGGAYSQALKDILLKAEEKGILIIASAGNTNTNLDKTPSYPASYHLPNMIVVASVTPDGSKSISSSYGPNTVDLAAPGTDIYSTVPGNKYDYKSGTSMATPLVTGAAALIWSEYKSWNYSDVKNLILENVKKLDGLKGKVKAEGIVDLKNIF